MGVAAIRPLTLFCVFVLSSLSLAQTSARVLITKPVDETQRTVLKGNTHPLARAEFDLGVAPMDLPMNRMLLVLKRSDEQEAALRSLIDNQQDKSSPNYHKWLTPEGFGKQFGPSDQDISQVTSWLQSHGFQIAEVSKGRTVIEFSGTAAQVLEAMHTSIHKYALKGEEHWANASDPQVPSALTNVVAGIESLNNFARKPMYHMEGVVSRSKSTGVMKPLQPLFTIPSGGCGVQSADCYGVGPYDFATIYNVSSLWSASPAIDGTGQAIAIVGETDINPQDVADFRNFFGLPALTPSQLNIIHNGPAPGILQDGEETESDLDVEWSGAVAKGATIDFVVSESTETTVGVDLSAEYIVDNNIAPVMSESYGLCELGLGSTGNIFFNQLWQQAAAEGITVFIATGDSGSAVCDSHNAAPPAPAQFGLAVSGFASTPYNVAVGGTDFNDLTNAGTYWSLSNNSTTQASALSYIPETTWNNTCTNSVFGTLLGFSTNAETNCNNTQLQRFVNTVGGSGGKSNCTSSDGQHPASCAGGYSKPSWQTGSNIPPDGVRDIPDVSLFAAAGSPSGSFYIICEADQVGGFNSCNPASSSTNFLGIGGTSASAPAFAGIMALVNQQTNSRQGNANFVFYKLAAQQAGVFNDVTTGTIAMPCLTGTINCNTAVSGDTYGVLSGYNTGPGYDLATGLGSVNVANLVNKWNTVNFNASTTTLTTLSPTTITHGQTVNVSVKVTGNSGTPTGTVSLLGGASGTQFIDSHALDNAGTATWTTTLLPGGSYNVKAHYAGDGNYGGSDSAPSPVVVNKESSSAQIQLITFDSSGRETNSNATTVVYGSPYILRVNVMNSAGANCANYPQVQSGCPSGNVALTDNGSPLDGGTFPLNNLGYTEDQPIQLSGGGNSLQAVYGGDNSYSASPPAADAVTVTPAPTTMIALSSINNASVGSFVQLQVTAQAQGSGAAPGGTITFFVNGAPISGTVTYVSASGALAGIPYLQANLFSSSSPFPTPGTYTISANYSGDGNYAGSSASGSSTIIKYPAPGISLQSSAYTVPAGTNLTWTAQVISSSPTLAPTGTVAFYSNTYGQLSGSPAYSTFTDQNGNLDLQATLMYTINASDNFSAVYSGDSNYPGGTGYSGLITVTGSDFNLAFPQGTMTVAKGQSNGLNLLVGMQSGASPVTFSATPCSGLPAESTCNVSPSTLTYTSTVQVSVSARGPHSAAQSRAVLNQRASWWITAFGTVTVGIFLFGSRARPRGGSNAFLSLILLGFLAVGLGCGGGGGGGGGGGTQIDPGTPAGSYAITVTGTSGSTTHTVKFTLIVQ
jgi:subtilase family serine protease